MDAHLVPVGTAFAVIIITTYESLVDIEVGPVNPGFALIEDSQYDSSQEALSSNTS